MISTRIKLRIPKTLSFPASLKDVAEVLADAPEWDDSSLVFWDQAAWPAAAFRRLLSKRLPYTILDAEYRPEPVASETAWGIKVYPVERSKRNVARQLLIRDGLPQVARWSSGHRNEEWRARYHRLEITFDPTIPSLGQQTFDAV